MKKYNLKTFKKDIENMEKDGRNSDDVCAEHRVAQIKMLGGKNQ